MPTLTPRPAANGPTIDVAQIIEAQRPGKVLIRLVLVAWLVTFFDGFDLNAIAFAAPYLSKAFAFDKSQLANIFVAGGVGALLGGVLFGALGDRIGRRRAILGATTAFGLLTLSMAACHTYGQLLAVRCLDGIALGGALPLIQSLAVEYVPTRYRATAVTLITLGYGIGVGAAGPVSLLLLPRFGWQAIFVFGGIASLLAALILFFQLPESLRFMAAQGIAPRRLRETMRWLDPGRVVAEPARYVLDGMAVAAPRSHSPRVLFSGSLRWVTPLLWLGYMASSMTSFFFTTWGPIVFESMGLSRSTAAWTLSMNSVAGALGGIALMRFTDRTGALSVAVLPAVTVPFLLAIGLSSVSPVAFVSMMALLFVLLGGSHYGIISISGTYYPTSCRAFGAGWMSAMGKLGSILAPWIGGLLLSSQLPVRTTFALLAVLPTVLALCAFAIGMLERAGRVRPAA